MAWWGAPGSTASGELLQKVLFHIKMIILKINFEKISLKHPINVKK